MLAGAGLQRRSAGIAAHAHSDLRTELADDLPCHEHALEGVYGNGDIA